MPVYIGKSGDLVRCYRCLTDTETTEYRATQLLSSIQFKLSHAIHIIITSLDLVLLIIVIVNSYLSAHEQCSAHQCSSQSSCEHEN